MYIAEALKPLRDFFLVLFFFAVGASFNLSFLHEVLVPAVILAVLIVVLKPLIYRYLLQSISESSKVSWEVGFRLGQASEFSLIVAAAALQVGIITEQVAYLIQATTILTFVVSCYFVVIKYPTPVALTRKLRTD